MGVRYALLAGVLVLAMLGGTLAPSRADTAGQVSTRNILLGALAATGIILYDNWQHKRAYANSVVGYTRDGGTVYGDGRIVYPNGTTIYTSNNGSTICTFDGYGQQCQPYNLYGYAPTQINQYGNYPYGANGNAPYYGNYPNGYYNNAAMNGRDYNRRGDNDRDDQGGRNGYFNGNNYNNYQNAWNNGRNGNGGNGKRHHHPNDGNNGQGDQPGNSN